MGVDLAQMNNSPKISWQLLSLVYPTPILNFKNIALPKVGKYLRKKSKNTINNIRDVKVHALPKNITLKMQQVKSSTRCIKAHNIKLHH